MMSRSYLGSKPGNDVKDPTTAYKKVDGGSDRGSTDSVDGTAAVRPVEDTRRESVFIFLWLILYHGYVTINITAEFIVFRWRIFWHWIQAGIKYSQCCCITRGIISIVINIATLIFKYIDDHADAFVHDNSKKNEVEIE